MGISTRTGNKHAAVAVAVAAVLLLIFHLISGRSGSRPFAYR